MLLEQTCELVIVTIAVQALHPLIDLGRASWLRVCRFSWGLIGTVSGSLGIFRCEGHWV